MTMGRVNFLEMPRKQVRKPRSCDYNLIYELHGKGLSMPQIVKQLGISIGTIQHALRIRFREEFYKKDNK